MIDRKVIETEDESEQKFLNYSYYKAYLIVSELQIFKHLIF